MQKRRLAGKSFRGVSEGRVGSWDTDSGESDEKPRTVQTVCPFLLCLLHFLRKGARMTVWRSFFIGGLRESDWTFREVRSRAATAPSWGVSRRRGSRAVKGAVTQVRSAISFASPDGLPYHRGVGTYPNSCHSWRRHFLTGVAGFLATVRETSSAVWSALPTGWC